MPPSLRPQGKRRPQGVWKKKFLETGQCGKNKFSTLHTKFSTFKCGKNFLKKERRLEVSLYIYSNILNNQKMIQGLQLAVLQEILLFKRWGCGVLSCYGGVPFCSPRKEPKMRRGLAPRSASAPVANSGPHYGGRFPETVPQRRRGQ